MRDGKRETGNGKRDADRRSLPVSRFPFPLLVLALSLAVPRASPAQAIDRQIRENQARLDSIRNERTDLQTQLDRLRGRARDIRTELNNLERQRSATSRLVNELDRQMATLGTQLDTITLDLLLAEDELAEKRAVRERRIVEIYKRGELWVFEVLLAAESFGDLLSRYKYLYLVSRQDQALVTEVRDLRDRIARERRNLALVQGEVGRNRSDRQGELDRYQRIELERQRSLRATTASTEATTERLSALERDERQINSHIAALERRRREAVAAGLATFPATITDESMASLEWPADGPVLYRFGRATGPRNTVVRYNGLGIKVPIGTEVRAVAGGQVEIAASMGTYGPSVMINHGGGFFTLYLFLSAITVAKGRHVEGGTVIGRSGGQGTEEGPHFEFQLHQMPERSGTPLALDPLNWLKPRP
jgi:septal ring factor EnvC (AmiA/AmiB activator)